MAVATKEYGLFIDGELVRPAGELRDLREPATGQMLARAAMANETEVDRAVAAARAALDCAWGKTPGTERSRLLHALADAIAANRKELAELESRNVGKAISSVKAEIAGATENFRYYASAIASIAGRSNPIGGSLLFYSQKEPVGVAAQIVPWNYPLMMATWKLAPAGKPTSFASSAMRSTESGVCGSGLRTTAQPAANAGESFHVAIRSG